MYKDKQYYGSVDLSVQYAPFVALPKRMNVYFRGNDGKLGQFSVPDPEDHEDAILQVKEALVDSGEGWNAPVLAVIKGGKK